MSTKHLTNEQLHYFLLGWVYSDRKDAKHVLERLSVNSFPEDLACIIGALSRGDRKVAVKWFEDRGVLIKDGGKASDAVIALLLERWQYELTERLRRALEVSQILTPGQFRNHVQGILDALDRNGVKPEKCPIVDGPVNPEGEVKESK